MATVREYFAKAFRSQMTFDKRMQAVTPGGSFELEVRVHADVEAHVRFLSIFVETSDQAERVAENIISNLAPFLSLEGISNITLPRMGDDAADTTVGVELNPPAPPSVKITGIDGAYGLIETFPFSGRVYIYSGGDVSSEFQEKIRANLVATGLTFSFRGTTYAVKLDSHQHPWAFLSHDSRDKAAIALPIALGLQRLQCPVWYDEFSMTVGHSLRESIEQGVKDCAYCTLLLSPNFLSKGGWPKREYTMAFTKELVEDRNVVLPVWHDVSRDDVYSYSPILADRVGVSWALGCDAVCRRLYIAMEKRRESSAAG